VASVVFPEQQEPMTAILGATGAYRTGGKSRARSPVSLAGCWP
jgi:hypothetical protein